MSVDMVLKELGELPEFLGVVMDGVNTRGNFGDFPLNVAVVLGRVDYVKDLLDAGADINAKGEHGYTALHDAVEQGNSEMVALLIAKGADTTIENNDGLTAKQFSEVLNQKDVEKYF